jgi:hypothetical protein
MVVAVLFLDNKDELFPNLALLLEDSEDGALLLEAFPGTVLDMLACRLVLTGMVSTTYIRALKAAPARLVVSDGATTYGRLRYLKLLPLKLKIKQGWHSPRRDRHIRNRRRNRWWKKLLNN